MSAQNVRPDNWLISTKCGRFAFLLFNIERKEVLSTALNALALLQDPEEEPFQEEQVKFTRYTGSTLIVAFKPDRGEFAEVMLSDNQTAEALYSHAGWELPEIEDEEVKRGGVL